MSEESLTHRQEAFCAAMADPTCKGPSEAYARAGYAVASMKPSTIASRASEVSALPHVAARIQELRNAAAAKAMTLGPLDVLREWVTIATADPSELTRVRRWCCRHCYGIGHRYQWIDDDEFAVACARVMDYNATKSSRQHARALPDFEGGTGYQRDRVPVASCPRCNGDGDADTFIADTLSLSPAARKLFAGVKQTQFGVEVKMRDQDGALLNIAKYLGMLAERHMHGGDPNNPTPIKSAAIIGDMPDKEAAQIYQAVVAGGK